MVPARDVTKMDNLLLVQADLAHIQEQILGGPGGWVQLEMLLYSVF